jgi:hypothetical protein
LGVAACDVDQTEEGELPEVDIQTEGGNLPEYDVEGPEVSVDTEKKQIEVPDVDIDTEEKTVEVPDVDVDLPGEQDNGTNNQ